MTGQAIEKFIGRRSIVVFGNSDGDLQMLQWASAGPGARFRFDVHRTDAKRGYYYRKFNDDICVLQAVEPEKTLELLGFYYFAC